MNHIAMLIPTVDHIAGAERQAMLLVRGLRTRGWRVTVLALSGSGGDAARELADMEAGFMTLELRKGLADLRGWRRLRQWIQSEHPDVLHAHMPHAAWMARWSRVASPVRVALDTIHTSATGTLGRRLGYRWSRWLPDCVTAVSEAVRQAYLKAGMIAPERCLVVANGVDTERWRPDGAARAARRGEIGIGEDFLWLAAGRLDPVKDYETMLRAFALLPAASRLAITGEGPEEQALRGLSRELGIAERVRFLGFVSEIERWMQAADGFVLSSRWEGLPMGLIEAAACGLPAVATGVAGSRDVIVDGRTGWLAEAGSPTSLAGKMRQMMNLTLDERAAMGEDARESAVGRFSLARTIDNWEGLYSELLQKNRSPRRWAR